jgi:hypothetical protein|tara:strand:- start:49 stop:240 length:192 start_codon:yes stop_codon:yes gene_type:complete
MDKKEALKIVQEDGYELGDLSDNFKKDKEIVLEAVKENGFALQHADDSLKNDPDILAIINKKK